MISRLYHFLSILILALLCSGCAGSFLGGAPKEVSDLEEIGTRRANAAEEKRLDACLYYLFKKQQNYHQRTGQYIREVSKLEPKLKCEKISVSLETAVDSYTAFARIRDGKESVKWSVNERGEVTEHDDLSFDLSL